MSTTLAEHYGITATHELDRLPVLLVVAGRILEFPAPTVRAAMHWAHAWTRTGAFRALETLVKSLAEAHRLRAAGNHEGAERAAADADSVTCNLIGEMIDLTCSLAGWDADTRRLIEVYADRADVMHMFMIGYLLTHPFEAYESSDLTSGVRYSQRALRQREERWGKDESNAALIYFIIREWWPHLDPVTIQDQYTPGMVYRLMKSAPDCAEKIEQKRKQ